MRERPKLAAHTGIARAARSHKAGAPLSWTIERAGHALVRSQGGRQRLASASLSEWSRSCARASGGAFLCGDDDDGGFQARCASAPTGRQRNSEPGHRKLQQHLARLQ